MFGLEPNVFMAADRFDNDKVKFDARTLEIP